MYFIYGISSWFYGNVLFPIAAILTALDNESFTTEINHSRDGEK